MLFQAVIWALVVGTNSQNTTAPPPLTCASVLCGPDLICEDTPSGSRCVKPDQRLQQARMQVDKPGRTSSVQTIYRHHRSDPDPVKIFVRQQRSDFHEVRRNVTAVSSRKDESSEAFLLNTGFGFESEEVKEVFIFPRNDAGKCPVVPKYAVGTCLLGCQSDSNCTAAEKCCNNGCGDVCFDPANPGCSLIRCVGGYRCVDYPSGPQCELIQKPGECPAIDCPQDAQTQIACGPDTCSIDSDCDGSRICCQGCNNCSVCLEPFIPEPPSCRTVKCSEGYVCELRDVVCKKEPCYPQPTCVKVGQCPQKRCAITTVPPKPCEPTACLTDRDCNGTEKCCTGCDNCGYCIEPSLPPPPTCDSITCKEGEVCVLTPIICVTTPCYPEPQCVRSCFLPKDPGTCKGKFPSWYYDTNSGKCQQFYYGGCDGNDNRFKTLDDCQKTCRDIKCPEYKQEPKSCTLFDECSPRNGSQTACTQGLACCRRVCGRKCVPPVY